jgi:hypothetical protein
MALQCCEKATRQLLRGLREDWLPEEIERLVALLPEIRLVSQGKARVVLNGEEPSLAELIASVQNQVVVSVNRSDNNQIDPGVKVWLLWPEYEHHGPSEFELASLESLLHKGQEPEIKIVASRLHETAHATVTGYDVFSWLLKEGRITSCLSLLDGLAIQQRGVEVFKKQFGTKQFPLWKSTASERPGRQGRLCVPVLCLLGYELVIRWVYLDEEFTFSYVTLCHKEDTTAK